MLATLACSLLDGASTEKSSRIIIRQILPTLTPTVNPDPNSAALAALTTEATPPQPPQATSPVMTPAENPNRVESPSPAPFEANSQQASNGIDDATSSDPTITPIAAPTPDPSVILGDQLEPFEICVDSVSRQVARHELRVWGE